MCCVDRFFNKSGELYRVSLMGVYMANLRALFFQFFVILYHYLLREENNEIRFAL